MINKKIMAGNWKMNLGVSEAVELASQLVNGSEAYGDTAIWIAPSTQTLAQVSEIISGSKISLGSQNIHWEEKGAFTGELSIPMAKEVGCSFSLTGHSERRHVMEESNLQVAKRTLAALNANFKIILCIGETLTERESGTTHQILKKQLEPVLSEVSPENLKFLVIAYEPVWAIGTGKVATSDEIEDAHSMIRDYCLEFNQETTPPILYGGSVSPDNFEEIVDIPNVAGALVGGASLSAEKFLKLIDIAEKS